MQLNIVVFHPPMMQSPFDLLPSITGNKLQCEPYPGATSVVGLVFQDVDTTYKFFWFLTVLHKANVAPFRTDLSLEIKELARETMCSARSCMLKQMSPAASISFVGSQILRGLALQYRI
jgi:hypothetical protein